MNGMEGLSRRRHESRRLRLMCLNKPMLYKQSRPHVLQTVEVVMVMVVVVEAQVFI